MNKRKCDCGARPYYDEPIAQGNMLCESCYVGELEAIADTQEFYRSRIKELENTKKFLCYRINNLEQEIEDMCEGPQSKNTFIDLNERNI